MPTCSKTEVCLFENMASNKRKRDKPPAEQNT